MLNRKEQEKGGFGAFTDRDRERRDVHDADATGAVDATDATDATDGSPAPAPEPLPEAPRRRLFRSML